MANLLPVEHKQGITNEYRLRLAASGLGLLAVVLLAGIALLVPSFVLTESRHQQHKSTLNSLNETTVSTSTKENKAAIKEANNKLNLISVDNQNQNQPTKILQLLAETQSSGVQINSITFVSADDADIEADDSLEISISGVASSRNDLLSFEESLKNRARVSAVDLPIGTLARRENTAFDMTVTIQPL